MARRSVAANFVLAALLLLGVAGGVRTARAGSRTPRLPDAVADAVEEAFPGGVIVAVEQEREHGVMLFELSVRQDGRIMEVEVSSEGVIGEIETVLSLRDVPADAARSIAEKTKGGKITRIERHERRGAIRSGKLVKLDKPIVIYEVRFRVGRRRRRIVVASDETAAATPLPEKARESLTRAFPGSTIERVELEPALGCTFYEVHVKQDGIGTEVTLASDGTIIEAASTVGREDLPGVVSAAIAKFAAADEVVRLQRKEVRAVVRLAGLQVPRVIYEARISREDETVTLRALADGEILSRQHNPDGEEEEEEEPEALSEKAKAAIEKAFPGATLGATSRERELGLTLCSAHLQRGGMDFAVKATPGGMIVEVEREVAAADIPRPAADAIRGAATDAEAVTIREMTAHALPLLVGLGTPQTTYEAQIIRGGRLVEVEVSPDGVVRGSDREDGNDTD